MKLNVFKTLPPNLWIAFSGGVDSVVLAHLALSKGIMVGLAHYHHGNDLADAEYQFVKQFATDHSLLLSVGWCDSAPTGSKEKFWRDSRYRFFKSLDCTVATGANLDDAVEWYLMTCLRGRGEFMPYTHANVIRPLLLSRKSEIIKYALDHSLNWYEDASNSDVEFTPRNRVRHEILPQCLQVNPGLYSVVKKKIFDREFGKNAQETGSDQTIIHAGGAW